MKDFAGDRFSTPFLICWILIPGVILLATLFLTQDVSSLIAVAMSCLLLAGIALPIELQQRQQNAGIRLPTLLLYWLPFFLVAGRLEHGDWMTLALLVYLGFWLLLIDSLWRWGKASKRQVIPIFLFCFLALGVGAPWLGYLLQDFVLQDGSWQIIGQSIARCSPFDLVVRLAYGQDFVQGTICMLLLFFICRRGKQQAEAKA